MGRAPCCEKVGLRKGRWTAEEDEVLTKYIQSHGEGSWRSLPKNAGLLRCGKSCRLRWVNYLRKDLKRGNITPQEEHTIVKLHNLFGNRWSMIAAHLPGRTDNEIKNYWNSHLLRKLYTYRKPSDDSLPPLTGILDVSPPRSRRTGRRNRTAAEDKNAADKSHAETVSPGAGEAVFGAADDQDGELGAYEWLDGEIMRLNNERREKVTAEECYSGVENEEWGKWVWEVEDGGFLKEWEWEEISSSLWDTRGDNEGIS